MHEKKLRRVWRRASSPHALAIALALAATAPAVAQTASSTAPVNLDLGSVLAAGSGDAALLPTTPGTAPYEAPSHTPLDSTQPTSVVNKHTIQNLLVPTQSYADAARLTPSVNNISPNGPGLMETVGPTIRGFQDGQYNLTFDGIPLGDSNDFTHHSTSFFSNNMIGQVIVDRGPGTAETIGDATFGGTMSIRSINPASQLTLTPSGGYGSYDTSVEGLQLDTGSIRTLNGTSAVFAIQHDQTGGALTNANQERSNFFGKVVIPVSSNTVVTLLADYNRVYQNPSVGATLEQMELYGSNYAYNNDPNSQGYYKFNSDHITTDMEYIDVQSTLTPTLHYDGKIYTYAYYHHDLNGDDPMDVGDSSMIPNEAVLQPGGPAVAGVPGETFMMDYRSVGTIQRLQQDFNWGDVKTGVWFDHQVNTRYLQENDLSDGNAVNYDPNDANGGTGIDPTTGAQLPGYDNDNGSIDRLQHNQLYTFQPYLQTDYKPIQALTLTAGVKYAFFRRQLDAQVQQGDELPTGYSHDWGQWLPSFEARYAFTPNLSAYAQVAEGFLAPNLNTFYTPNVSSQSLAPEKTWNYQIGTAYQTQHVSLGADAYLIHFTNYIAHKGSGINEVFYNGGGAIYKGLEGDIAYSFDAGLTLFANAGLNQSNFTGSNAYIAQAPQGTANFGVIYDKNGINFSVIDQWTGGEYGSGAYSSNNPRVPGPWYDPYNVVNLAGGYTFNHLAPHLNHIKVNLNLDNITNQRQIIFDNGTNNAGQTLYYVLPGVSAFFNVSVPLTF